MNERPLFPEDSPVFEQMLSVLRSALWGEDRFPLQLPKDADWKAIYRELKHHAVQHIPLDLLVRENPADGPLYMGLATKSMTHGYEILLEQQKICNLLEKEGIPCAIVKGTAVSCYYPQPNKREMGDIDLLVKPEDFDRACQIVSEGAEFLGENFRHKEYRRGKLVVEVHRAFGTFRKPEKNALFDRRIFGAIDRAEDTLLEGFRFPRLPRTENGLVLLEHIDIHLENGLGLRQILDWMLFAQKELSDEVWHREFFPFLKDLERETLAITVTRMCQLYLGLSSDITWCTGADEALCRELMLYILHQGNFGRKKQKSTNRAASVISASGNIVSFFRILQNRGCINWQALTRFPWLKPFAWLYQLLRYLYYGIRSEHPIQFLQNAKKQAKSQSNLMEALGVSRMAEEGS